MRSLNSLVLALLAAASTPLASPSIRAIPVPLERTDPARVRVGRLRYLGGWELASNDSRFGGLSSMVWRDQRLVAVSDAGAVFSIGFVDGVPAGRVLRQLPDGPGTGDDKSDRDSESLTTEPASGAMWVGFETHNAIWRYDTTFSRASAHAEPAAMRKWPLNGGAEAMIRLPDGRFLVFSEKARGPDHSTALLLFAGDPTSPATPPALLAGYRAPPGYSVTDVARLHDGKLLLLHRRFALLEGVSAIVSILDPGTIRAGHAAAGKEVARLAPPLTVDNMEALAVTRERGRTILWIASDDNFNPLQRTLLLKFALAT